MKIRIVLIICCYLLCNLSFAINTLKSESIVENCRCLPNEPCWPDAKAWTNLASSLDGKLIKPQSLTRVCDSNFNGREFQDQLVKIKNPFYIQSQAGGTQSQGWLNGWQSTPSIYGVEVHSTKDIALAINFARKYNLRLVIKGGGHDYLGRSSAPDSLLIWTHAMRNVSYLPSFRPAGAPVSSESGIPAVSVEAGARWLDVYSVATTKEHKYVQGGGCASVGAAGGFIQGGGFGSFSKEFGTGAAGVLQAEIVTADGKILIANQYQNQDLFWAIRGGGGGTYGVVSKLILRAHDLPNNFGIYKQTITATNDQAFKDLIKKFLIFYNSSLNNQHWGEQFAFNDKNQLDIFMVYQGINETAASHIWASFNQWLIDNQQKYKFDSQQYQIPAASMWDYDFWHKNYPQFVKLNTRPEAGKGEYWWASNTAEASMYIYTYQSWWLPESLLLNDKSLDKLTDAFFRASRVDTVSVHINKGLAGADVNAIKAVKLTSTNPQVLNAAGLVIMAAGSEKYVSKDKIAKDQKIMKHVAEISAIMNRFRSLAPSSGTYVNEADFFQKNWQNDFWGSNYESLYRIKQKYDPAGLFYCHHCVGSELWNDFGMCRK